MPEQPANPEPAHHNIDSMLSRKFGKEVANYFSGNPLNRVGFLREKHDFLDQALKHPSTSFLPCNNLQPLVKTGYKTGDYLQFVKYDEIKPIIGDGPYDLTEKEVLARYNSEQYIPQMIFLGIDEKDKQGLTYQGKNEYTGAPYFAIDVTPKAGVKDACEKLIKNLEERGLSFAPGRVMEIDATHGKSAQYSQYRHAYGILTPRKPPCTPKRACYSTGTSATPTAAPAATPPCPSTGASSAPAPPKTSPRRPASRTALRA